MDFLRHARNLYTVSAFRSHLLQIYANENLQIYWGEN